jgi:hypothetical protein
MQQIERYGLVPDRQIHLVHWFVFQQRATGTIHDYVEFAESLDGFFDRTLYAFIVGDIRVNEDRISASVADLALCSGAGITVKFEKSYFRAFPREGFCRRLGNASACTCEKRNLPLHPAHMVQLLG